MHKIRNSGFKIKNRSLNFSKGNGRNDSVLYRDSAGNTLRRDISGKYSVVNRQGGTVSGKSFIKFIKDNPQTKKYFT